MSPEELALYIAPLIVTAVAVLIVLYATRLRKKGEEEHQQPLRKPEAVERWRYRIQRTVTLDKAKGAGEELRTLSLEREILSDAIRRLYEAHAEGRITKEEREQLAETYKSRMMRVKEAITDNESVVALHELEEMQDDLTKLFNDRFDELNTKIETLRSQIGLETEEVIVPTQIPEPGEIEVNAASQKVKKSPLRKPKKSRKTAAEERIEKIRIEVEKVLDRLEQMEAEV